MQQLQKQHGGTASRCNNVFDAMDTQPPTPTSGKKSDASKIIASLDKPGMFLILRDCFVCYLKYEFLVHVWTSYMDTHLRSARACEHE
jgi:hypothetical protein